MNDKELTDLYESYVNIYEAADRTEARTDISYAREAIRNARGNLKKYPQGHNGDDFRHEHKLAKEAFKNLVNQERGKLKDSVEYVLDYLIDEGYANSYEGAEAILETMSDEWLEGIIEKYVVAMDPKRKGPDHRSRTMGDGAKRRLRKTPDIYKYTEGDFSNRDLSPGARRRRQVRTQARGGRSYTEN